MALSVEKPSAVIFFRDLGNTARLITRLDEDNLRTLQSSHRIHLNGGHVHRQQAIHGIFEGPRLVVIPEGDLLLSLPLPVPVVTNH